MRVTLGRDDERARNATAARDDARARATSAATTMAPGAIGRRAEQLGGFVGVRAASLSIDFVDPARLSLLSAAPPSMPTLTPAGGARRARYDHAGAAAAVRDASAVARGADADGRGVVAGRDVPVGGDGGAAGDRASVGAVERAAARDGARGGGADAHDAGERSRRRGRRPHAPRSGAARGGAPSEYVAPTVAPTETQGRLPGGRTPRGSFTWPKLADYVPSRAEWTAPVAVALAEQTKQAAPGTPLWGALPALIAVSPSLAASGFGGGDRRGDARRRGSARRRSRWRAGELVRGDGTSRSATAMPSRDAVPQCERARGMTRSLVLVTRRRARGGRERARARGVRRAMSRRANSSDADASGRLAAATARAGASMRRR